MAARRSQRRRGRRGEPGTALLAPLVLGLGLALACLGLLLVVVSLGSRASLSAQVRPRCTPLLGQIRSGVCGAADGAGWAEDKGPGRWVEGEMSGGEGQGDAASFPAGAFPGGAGGRGGPGPTGEWELNPQTEESQDLVPFLKRLVRPRRSAPKGRKTRARRAIAAHYEVHSRPGQDGAQAGVDGTVSGWEEAKINSSNPLRYDRQSGEFIVTRAGLYYLYCQVHFDEGKAVYLKLDLLVDDTLALRCLEEFSATAASSLGPQLRLCQVSGLLPLRPGSSLRIRTLPWAHLKAAPFLTYFGLFQLMPASSPSLLAPKGPPGDMGGPVREPALSVALWLSWGAALGAVACAMALLTQQTELQTLRREVTRLQRTGGPSEKGEGYPWLSLQEQSPDALEAGENRERSRRRRAVLTHKQKRKHSVLHLVPINITSKEDSDVTEVMWQPALRRGRGLEAQGYVVRVWDAGVYLLYSQVLFHDVTFTMGQVVSREGQGRQETLFRCIRSMPSNPDWAYNSCYSAGVFHLHQGDILSVIIPRARAKLSLSPHGTFLGGSLRESSCLLAEVHEAFLHSGKLLVPFAKPLSRYPLPLQPTRSLILPFFSPSIGPQFPSLSPEVYLLCAHLQGVPDEDGPFAVTLLFGSQVLPFILSLPLAWQATPSPSGLGRVAGEPWKNRTP
ncbi:hypothetical protein HPG69_015816 [Diceros bicornis minor]|uniref:Tumor necrosis factor ligand superfamily member 12 n=1 Tax=Diceros bicornis minor TaxID=77932 RepID=A0A7J7E7Y6_DICBM|nr:hypothetical protein HPG69_015816 [Diceros bicornis minor]